ncbi:Nn.00g036420.m01.CDS01 [Neocucurbitaria sp. VM-36]
MTSNASDTDEARGKRAYDGIRKECKDKAMARQLRKAGQAGGSNRVDDAGLTSQCSRDSSSQMGLQRLSKIDTCQHNLPAEHKPVTGTHMSDRRPSISHAVTRQKSRTARLSGHADGDQEEQDDIAEAISRSLADNVAPFSKPHLAAPSTQKRTNQNNTIGTLNSQKGHDKPMPATPSGSASPHVPLHSLLEDLNVVASVIEKRARKMRKVDLDEMVALIRGWESTVFGVIHAHKVFEDQRIKDIQMNLDFDRQIEKQHQKQLEQVNKTLGTKMVNKKKEFVETLEKQKRLYESLLAEQSVAMPSAPNERHPRPQRVTSVSPPIFAVTQLQKDIQALKADHAATILSMEANSTSAIDFLKQKVDRLCDENAALRETLKTKGDTRTHEPELVGVESMHDVQGKLLEQKIERSADGNAGLRREKLQVSGLQGGVQTASRSPAGGKPGKRSLCGGGEERLESVNWSPKKAKNGH